MNEVRNTVTSNFLKNGFGCSCVLHITADPRYVLGEKARFGALPKQFFVLFRCDIIYQFQSASVTKSNRKKAFLKDLLVHKHSY